jgi:hypothetical protein
MELHLRNGKEDAYVKIRNNTGTNRGHASSQPLLATARKTVRTV